MSYITLLPIVNPDAIDLDTGVTFRPNPVGDNLIELGVMAILSTVSKDFIIAVNDLHFLNNFLDLFFLNL